MNFSWLIIGIVSGWCGEIFIGTPKCENCFAKVSDQYNCL
jgi:hypothetical protein